MNQEIQKSEKPEKDELTTALERQQYARAVRVASSRRPEHELTELKAKALWQIAAVYRNAPGAKVLAAAYGFSRDKVEELLKKEMTAKQEQGDLKVLGPCFDYTTNKYLIFEDWMNKLFQNWDNLPND
jgi:hypothetical protein